MNVYCTNRLIVASLGILDQSYSTGSISQGKDNDHNLVKDLRLDPKVSELLKKNTPAEKAFLAFEVNKATGNLLESPQWKNWAAFVVKRNNNNNPEGSLASAMMIQFGVDKAFEILAAAAKIPKTKEVATKLKEAKINGWLSHGSRPDAIFEAMKLNQKIDNFFDSPQFTTWAAFLKAVNEKNKNKKSISELDVFKKFYEEDDLLKLLSSADNIDNPRTQKYLDELATGWLDQPMHPQNVFNKLKLDEAVDDLLTKPWLSNWVEYMKKFNEQYPFAQTSMIKSFTKSYGDEKLAVMLQAATKGSDAHTARIAKNLQQAQFKQWMIGKLNPDDVYKTVLKLDSTSSPKAEIWRAFYNAYDTAFPGQLFSFKP
ncbi:hypothetical protein PPTG_13723 [Phytophthora nicotianae INRA-310]|uniref:RxLR effector protein n=1 Tax=Phytophthora nicotianae (strain INRA-310) TaxID=761204 RepID=W2PZL1_PHYN3|nr:hypothetical protein PPTG_13723 [Phytophthora nicotianae INRA-310]ETN06378.1 hypothetical protein PPTG_13723 [Phytophthora nicotianae INRA-310]